MTTDEYVYPTRRNQIIWLIVFVAFGYMLVSGDSAFSSYADWLLSHKDAASIEHILALQSVLVAIFFVGLGIFLACSATIMLRQKQYPPKSFPVVFRTKVRRGAIAVVQAVAAYFLSAAAFAAAGFFGYKLWLSWITLSR